MVVLLYLTLFGSLGDAMAGQHVCKKKVDRHVVVTAIRVRKLSYTPFKYYSEIVVSLKKRPLIDDTRVATLPLGVMEAIVLDMMSQHLNFT